MPGPAPVFTERIQVKVRPDQRAALRRVAGLVEMTEAEALRWIIDHGTAAIEQGHAAANREEH